MNVKMLPPYALTDKGESMARKGASEASKVRVKLDVPIPSRNIHTTSDLTERGKAGGSMTLTTAEVVLVMCWYVHAHEC